MLLPVSAVTNSLYFSIEQATCPRSSVWLNVFRQRYRNPLRSIITRSSPQPVSVLLSPAMSHARPRIFCATPTRRCIAQKNPERPDTKYSTARCMCEPGIGPGQLKLEVTESTVMEHSERSLKVLSDIDQLGVQLSTDDFGTGYSSLSYLQRFPFERLKIDRSFTKIMDENEKSTAIVKTILMLGENLGIEVVAEGIETVSQLDKLRELGCTHGQGYLFSRPVDRETAEQFLEHGANVFADNPSLQFSDPALVIEVADVQ